MFFGDTHLHTSWSTDAGMAGATLDPDAAYRVSRGEEVMSHLGWRVKLNRPLDFLVVADHAENLGLADFIRRSDPIILANETGKRWHDLNKAGNGYDAFLEWVRAGSTDLINEPRMMEAVWERVVENADRYYQPGVFTTFHGFEWTSHPDGNNMHRVVIFRNGGDRTGQVLPYSQYDSVDASGLAAVWARENTREGIYDVAVSDGRTIGADGRARASVGSTVDVEDASYTNTIGEPFFAAFWEDPDFDPSQSAFYDVRVLEIPTPRWTAFDAKFFNVEMPEGTTMELQDRAYTSPIWNAPGN